MKHLIVYAHPSVESFNHAIMEAAVGTLEKLGHEVVVRDLYALDFQPVLRWSDITAINAGDIPADIKDEHAFIAAADVITWIYPIWWTGLPAILKGYVDRVFSDGFAYAVKGQEIEQLLQGKKGFSINTHSTTKEEYDRIGMTDGLRVTSDVGIYAFCGIEAVGHLWFGNVVDVDDAARKEMLKQVVDTLHDLFND